MSCAVSCWLLAVGCWLLVVGCWLLAVGCWRGVGAEGCTVLYGVSVVELTDTSERTLGVGQGRGVGSVVPLRTAHSPSPQDLKVVSKVALSPCMPASARLAYLWTQVPQYQYQCSHLV